MLTHVTPKLTVFLSCRQVDMKLGITVSVSVNHRLFYQNHQALKMVTLY